MEDVFTQEDRERRFNDLSIAAVNFAKQYESRYSKEISIDFARIFNVIISACDDIGRYKLYHLEKPQEQRSNDIKRAVYYTKWLLKFRPFSLVQHHGASDVEAAIAESSNTNVVLINELFALKIALGNISILAHKRVFLSPVKMQEILYTYLYHQNHDDKLMLIYQFIFDVATEQDVLR